MDEVISERFRKMSKSARPLFRIPVILSLVAFVFVTLSFMDVSAQSQSRIYGVIHTTAGEDLEGYIRWDKNEVGWDNILDGTKDRRLRDQRRQRRRKRDSWIRSLFGSSFGSSRSAQSGIQMGYIERLEPDGDNAVILTLKGGEELELRNGSTDIGTNIREILIDDNSQGEIELEWDEIEWVVFSEPERNSESQGSHLRGRGEVSRVYGTVFTRRRNEFTGFIGWDYDESLSSDILDGYVSGHKRKVKFERIVSIERRGSSGSIVITRDGKKLRMQDSNDVDDSNNGIVISDPSLGRILVSWDEFDRLELSAPAPGRAYGSYRVARPLHGVVISEDDEALEGQIVWDADEEYSWELLNGEYRDISLAIVFANIASIEKVRRGARVTLRDGREFRLRNSNDIDRDNKGIYVTLANGEREVISWDEFVRVDFSDN